MRKKVQLVLSLKPEIKELFKKIAQNDKRTVTDTVLGLALLGIQSQQNHRDQLVKMGAKLIK
jgi:hypothetical protein